MATVNRPPTARPQLDRARHFWAAGCAPNAGRQPDPGPQGPSQDPASMAHPQMPTRAVFYVPAPPPPPFLHYQWPVPFSYNPFPGFPGMEAPAYVMPHPHLQPVDYSRHFLHPVAHAQGPLYQTTNQMRRVRSPYPSCGRETTNSEVQTEPSEASASDKEGSVHAVLDSGRGTASISPSCSSSSPKQDSAEYPQPTSCVGVDAQVAGKSSPRPGENEAGESGGEASQKGRCLAEVVTRENGPPCKSDLRSLWSLSPGGGPVPARSASQQDHEVLKEGRLPVRDVVLCWRASTPQEAAAPPKSSENALFHSEDDEGTVCQSAAERNEGPGLLRSGRASAAAALGMHESKKTSESQNGGAHSFDDSGEVRNDDENESVTGPGGNPSGSVPYKLGTSRGERKLNESVWSVESLAAFIPNKDWILRNGMLAEDPENDVLSNQTDGLREGSRDGTHSRKFSPSDSAPLSDGCLVFSTPAGKANPPPSPTRNSVQSPEMTETPKRDPGAVPSEKDPPTCFQRDSASPKEAIGENGAPEPVADQNPQQDSGLVAQQAEVPTGASQGETPSSGSSAAESIPPTARWTPANAEAMKSVTVKDSGEAHLSCHQLCVNLADSRMAEFSSGSKGHCFCIGCHCNQFHESKCPFEELKSNTGAKGKHRAARKGKVEGVLINGRVQKNPRKFAPWRNKRPGGDGEHQQC
ncbi:serine/arginine repetitive matrix protein 2-like isoform X2 [Hippocampus zosterae]|uniref:serine/arginine repetitive matrix protein 2-like isoform X2 n=1 Tax=Hippocampus zosterae TaxID=109293 RepID=UPI00223DD973|nr:serine/arginine repetitive matrix protein 2-like isoform X2 [Hippocampus zosterae]